MIDRAGRVALILAMVLLGLAQAASLAWWGNGQAQWWLQPIALVGLLGGLHLQAHRSALAPAHAAARPRWWRSSTARAFGLGWLFATAWLTGTVWWLFISMHTYGGLPAPLSALAVLALSGFLALYAAAACAVYHRLL